MNLPLFTHSPYQLTSTSQGFRFVTDSGQAYLIYFSDGSGYFDGLEVARYALMFGFARLDENDKVLPNMPRRKRSVLPYDARVYATLMDALERFFEDERRCLVYVCDYSDEREQYRHKLFGRWFQKHNAGRFIRRTVGESAGLFAALVYSKGSPYAQELEESLPDIEDKIDAYS